MKKIWLIRFFTVTRTIISRIGFILRCEIVKTKRAGTLRCKSRHFHGPGGGGGGGGWGKQQGLGPRNEIFRVTFSLAFLIGSNAIQFFLAGKTTEINESAHAFYKTRWLLPR